MQHNTFAKTVINDDDVCRVLEYVYVWRMYRYYSICVLDIDIISRF